MEGALYALGGLVYAGQRQVPPAPDVSDYGELSARFCDQDLVAVEHVFLLQGDAAHGIDNVGASRGDVVPRRGRPQGFDVGVDANVAPQLFCYRSLDAIREVVGGPQ